MSAVQIIYQNTDIKSSITSGRTVEQINRSEKEFLWRMCLDMCNRERGQKEMEELRDSLIITGTENAT